MKKIYTIIIFTVLSLSGYGQKVAHYVHDGQSSFNFGTARTFTQSISKGSYQRGSEEYANGSLISSSVSTVNCGNVTRSYSSVGRFIDVSSIAVNSTRNYNYRITTPSYQGARQTTTGSRNCGSPVCIVSYSGGCDRFVSAVDVEGKYNNDFDYSFSKLSFQAVSSSSSACYSEGTLNLNSTVYWNRISLPKDYGPITFSSTNSTANAAISGNIIDISTLSGTYTIVARLPYYNSVATASFQLNVNNPPSPNAGNDLEFILGNPSIDLRTGASTTAGTWTTSGGNQSGTIWNGGAYGSISSAFRDFIATLTVGSGCTASDVKSIKVWNRIDPASSAFNYSVPNLCLSSSDYTVVPYSDSVYETVFFYRRNNVGSWIEFSGVIDISVMGAGTHGIRKRIRNKSYASSYHDADKTFTIYENPSLSWSSGFPGTCTSSGVINISSYLNTTSNVTITSNAGAAFTGTQFYPNISGDGTFTFTATRTVNGCQTTVSRSLTVTDPPSPPSVSADQDVCISEGSLLLSGSPAGGVWSGPGINASSGMINLGTAGVGVKQYVYTIGTAPCTATGTVNISINATPNVEAGANRTICGRNSDNSLVTQFNLNSLGFSPAVGQWSTSVSDLTGRINNTTNILDLTDYIGSETVRFTYTTSTNGCSASDDVFLTFNFERTEDILVLNEGSNCGSGSISLNVSNGNEAKYETVWYISELAENVLATGNSYTTPSLTSSRTYYVAARDIVTNCVTKKLPITATVNVVPVLTLNGDVIFCGQEGSQDLNSVVNLIGGVYTSSYVTGSVFDASLVPSDGTYIVNYTYTDPNTNCSASIEIPVEVGSGSGVNAGSDKNICEGTASVSLSGLPGGGTWSSTNPTVDALIDNSALRLNTSSLPGGSFDLVYSLVDGNGCVATDLLAVNISDRPIVAEINDVNICVGTTASFSVPNVSTGSNIFWFEERDATRSVANGTTFQTSSLSATRSYFYELRNESGCVSERTEVIANVVPNVVLNLGEQIYRCNDNFTLNLNEFVGSYTGGIWTGTNVENGIFNANNLGSGEYVFTYTYSEPLANCTSTGQKRVVIGAQPNLIASTELVEVAVAVEFSLDQANSISSIEWDYGDGNTSESLEGLHFYYTPGVYTVSAEVTFSNGCTGVYVFEDAIEVTGSEREIILSKKEDIFNGISLVPNPVKSSLFSNGEINTPSTIKLFDQTGRQVAVKNVESIKKGDLLFDVNDLQSGLYHIIISTSKGVKNFKIIKQ